MRWDLMRGSDLLRWDLLRWDLLRWDLLRWDLRALKNLVRTADGRKTLVSHAVVIVCMVFGAAALAAMFFGRGPVRAAVAQNLNGDLVRTLHAVVLLMPLLLVFGVGITSYTGELYKAPQVPMLLSAPVRSGTLILRAFLRSLFGWWVFACALAIPPTVQIAEGLPWSSWTALVIPVAVLALLAPLLALQLLLKVVVTRWLSGPRLRWWLTIANVGIAMGLLLLVLFGFLQSKTVSAALARWLEHSDGGLPWILEAPAALPAAVAGFAQDRSRLWAPLWMVLSAALPLALATVLYRRSYDVYCSAATPTVSQRARSRRWPVSPLRSLLAKTRAETVRVPSNLVFYAFLATTLVLILARGTQQPEHESAVPLVVHETFFLVGSWQGLALLVASLAFLAIFGDEQKQIAVLAASPLSRSTFLLGKLVAVTLPFVAMMLVTLVAAPLVAGVCGGAVLGYLLVAPQILLFDLGWILLFGTWPAFIRVHAAMPLANNMRSTVPALCIGAACTAGFYLQIKARAALVASYYGHGILAPHQGAAAIAWLLAASWVVGLLVFVGGFLVARRSFKTLLGPQRE